MSPDVSADLIQSGPTFSVGLVALGLALITVYGVLLMLNFGSLGMAVFAGPSRKVVTLLRAVAIADVVACIGSWALVSRVLDQPVIGEVGIVTFIVLAVACVGIAATIVVGPDVPPARVVESSQR